MIRPALVPRDEMHVELLDLREQYQLTENDFVLTQYGVNPICNWFLGTRAGLITDAGIIEASLAGVRKALSA